MQRKITQKQQKITDYEAIMRRQSQEIERLQALTWYQKLFGKKVNNPLLCQLTNLHTPSKP